MEFPRIAIVGAGNLSTGRIYPYIGAAGAKLVGVCDMDFPKAEKNAHLFGGAPYRDMGEMLDAEKPDGVIICIGPEAHAELAPVVMRRGIPVYTEKPPAANAANALQVAKVSKETGVLCVTAFKKRYSRAYEKAKAFLSEFPAENLHSYSIVRASGPYANDSPRTMLLLDFEIHMIDLSCYLFGMPEEVFAYSRGLDAYAVSLKYETGAVGTFNFNDARAWQVPTEEVEISIKGGNFMTIHNSSVWKIARDGKYVELREPRTFTSAGDDGYDTGHLAEIADFVAAVKEGRSTSRSSIFESYRSMVLYEAIAESAKTGKPVRPNCEQL